MFTWYKQNIFQKFWKHAYLLCMFILQSVQSAVAVGNVLLYLHSSHKKLQNQYSKWCCVWYINFIWAAAYTNAVKECVFSHTHANFWEEFVCAQSVSILIPECKTLYGVCVCVCIWQWWVESVLLVSCVGGQADSILLPFWQQLSTWRLVRGRERAGERDGERKWKEDRKRWSKWFSKYYKYTLSYLNSQGLKWWLVFHIFTVI